MSKPEGNVLFCYRVADCPIPNTRSRTDKCSTCGAEIWVAFNNPPVPVKLLCLQCGVGVMQANPHLKIEDPTLAQVTEVLAILRGPRQ